MSNVNALEWLVNWFVDNAYLDAEEVNDQIEVNYFEKGWIDSLQFVMLVSEIEEQFNIRFNNDEFQNRAFATVKGLAGIIEGRINGK